MAKKAVVVMDLRAEKFRRELDKTKAKYRELKDEAKRAQAPMSQAFKVGAGIYGGVLAAGFSISRIKSFITTSIDAATEQAAAENRLATAMKLKNQYTLAGFQAMKDYASQIQSLTIYGDEAVLAQQAFLVSLGFTEKQIREVISAAADLAAGTGQSLEYGVRNLAKTFSGSIGELGDMIPTLKTLTAEELKAGAAVSMATEKFKGQGAAVAATPTGQMQQMAKSWLDLKAAIGGGIAQGVMDTAKNFRVAAGDITKFNNATKEIITADLASGIQRLATGFAYIGETWRSLGVFAGLGGNLLNRIRNGELPGEARKGIIQDISGAFDYSTAGRLQSGWEQAQANAEMVRLRAQARSGNSPR